MVLQTEFWGKQSSKMWRLTKFSKVLSAFGQLWGYVLSAIIRCLYQKILETLCALETLQLSQSFIRCQQCTNNASRAFSVPCLSAPVWPWGFLLSGISGDGILICKSHVHSFAVGVEVGCGRLTAQGFQLLLLS